MIFLVNKPKGVSSAKVVEKVKKIFQAKKAGHTGTLDPLAEGLLIVLLNESTKKASGFFNLDKSYYVKLKLGTMTETYDKEGRIIKTVSREKIFQIKKEDFLKILKKFIGKIYQKPPVFSAIKIDGVESYKLARQGKKIDLKPRLVNIKNIKLISFQPPFVELEVLCSKGTYIRSLVNDMGEKLGVYAYVEELKRLTIGKYILDQAIKLEELEKSNYSIKALSSSEAIT